MSDTSLSCVECGAQTINQVDGDPVCNSHELDPHGKQPHEPGAKLDANKPMAAVIADFGLALLAIAEVGTYGVKKYARGSWESVPDGVQRYDDAMWRHLLKGRSELLDGESGLRHEAHAAWCALAKLELKLREK